MIELELLGVNGDSVVLTDAQGQRFTLVIDDALRSAVRRDRVSVPIPPLKLPPICHLSRCRC